MPEPRRQAGLIINPCELTTGQQLLVSEFLLKTDLKYLEKDTPYAIGEPPVEFQFTNPLIITQPSTAQNKKFYVVSTGDDLTLGKGAYSRAREILASIEVSPEKQLHYSPVSDKALRVKNTQKAQGKRVAEGTPAYRHEEAIQEFEIAKLFPHLNMEAPVEVKRDKLTDSKNRVLGGEYSKSYSVMNKLPGTGFADAEDLMLSAALSTKQIIENFLLPLLETYHEQIAKTGYVHRDIKPQNIQVYFSGDPKSTKATINFLDMDSCKKIGEKDPPFGTPGFMPPEVAGANCIVSPSRDVFGLAQLMAEAINPYIDAQTIIRNKMDRDELNNPVMTFFSLLEDNGGHYNLDAACQLSSDAWTNDYGVFSYLSDVEPPPQDAQADLKNLLQQMTDIDPAKRPSIEIAIQRLHEISKKIDLHYQAEQDKTATSTVQQSESGPTELTPPTTDSTLSLTMMLAGGDTTKAKTALTAATPEIAEPAPASPESANHDTDKQTATPVATNTEVVEDKKNTRSSFGAT